MESKIGSQQNALKALELKVKTEQMDAEDRIVKEMIDESSKQYEDVKKLVETKIASSLTSLKNELGDSFADKFDAFKKEILAEMQDMIVKPVETKCEAETPHKDIVSSECNESNGLDNLTSLEQKLLEKNKELEQKIQQLTESNEKLRNDLKQLLNTTKGKI